MKLKLPPAILLLLAACAPAVWNNPTKTQADFQYDYHDCENQSAQVAANWGMRGNPFVMADEISKCLSSKGWTRLSADDSKRALAVASNFYVLNVQTEVAAVGVRSGGQAAAAVRDSTGSWGDGAAAFELASISGTPYAVHIRMRNTSDEPLRVLWNDVTLVDKDGQAHRLVRSDIDLAKKDDVQPAALVPPHALIDATLFPADKVTRLGTRWAVETFIPKEGVASDGKLQPITADQVSAVASAVGARNVGAKYTVFVPTELQSGQRQYSVDVKISSVTLQKVTLQQFDGIRFVR